MARSTRRPRRRKAPCTRSRRAPTDQTTTPTTGRPPYGRPTNHATYSGSRSPDHGGKTDMSENLGALAALGVIGPGIGIGILAGLAASAIGRNPEAAGQIRGLAIILAAFAEGLGVLAVVVGLLAIFIHSSPATLTLGELSHR